MLWDEPKIFFLERRYFFSIILSEFLKNRVALQKGYIKMAVDIEKVRKSLEVCPIKWVGDGKFTNEVLDERHVRVVVPVEGLHLNHVGIVYAGTMFTAMELAAGAIFMCTYGLDEFVPIVSNFEISFLKPTKKDLVAEIEWTEEEAAERIKPIRERGRGRMPVEITLRDIDGVEVAKGVSTLYILPFTTDMMG